MEWTKRILAVFLMALIGCVTVFQCHHHDAVGHPFFTTYLNNELTGDLHAGDCQAHDCENDGHDDTAPCGMHLSDLLADDDDCTHHNACPLCSGAIPAEVFDFDFSMSEADVISTPVFREKACPVGMLGHVNTRRGPPCDMI